MPYEDAVLEGILHDTKHLSYDFWYVHVCLEWASGEIFIVSKYNINLKS